jgi:DNA-binding response OmpR family regulator
MGFVAIFETESTEDSAHASTAAIYASGLEIIPDSKTVLAGGRTLSLTSREFQVLLALASNPDRVTSREVVHSAVWGGDYNRRDRSVDVYVGRVRAKLAEAIPGRDFIHTHTGIGYRFSPTGD